VVYDVAPAVARENSIDVDANHHPHISFSFRDGGNEDLMYAKNITGTWVITTIDSSGSVGMENDIAMDSNTNLHISHFQWNGNRLKYSGNESGAWVTEVITDAAWDRTSIAIDSNHHPHIVNRGLVSFRIYYATNLSGMWVSTNTGISGSSPAIAIDSNDKVHLSYTSGSELKYATNVSGSWVTAVVTSGVTAGRHHSIVIDNQNKAHISFYDSVEKDLKYANNSTGLWSTYTVDSEGDVGRSNALVIDSLGYVHISYRDDTKTKLKYATTAPVPLTQVTIHGPVTGGVNTGYIFTATISPTLAAMPITYHWSPLPAGGQATAVVTYTWTTAGTKSIAVTATNAGGVVSDTHIIFISASGNGPSSLIYLPSVLKQ
jgi:hypothetical protein